MKKAINLLVFSLLLISALSKAQDILWEKSYGGIHAEYLFDVQPTADYGFILAGSSISGKTGNKEAANKGDLDYWIWKMDEKGDLDWQKSFGGSGVDLLKSIKLTNDGGYILAGTSDSKKGLDKQGDAKGLEDFWIIKLDAKGNELWQKTIGGTGQEKLQSIILTADGGYILGGSSSSFKNQSTEELYGKSENSRGNLDYWVVKLKENGTIEWQKTIGGKYQDELKSIVVLNNGNYLLGGYSNSPVTGDKTEGCYGLGDYWLVQLDKEGTLVWQKTIGGDMDDNLFSVFATKDGGFIAGGNSNSGNTDTKTKASEKGSDFWILKFDNNNNIEWQETYNYGEKDVLTSIIENEDGSFLIGGYAQSEVRGQKSEIGSKASLKGKNDKDGINDYIALKISAKGDEIWSQTVGSKGDEVMRKLLETRDGGYLLAGTSFSKTGFSKDRKAVIGGNDFWVVKLKDKDKPEKEKLPLEAFPNPAQTFTNVVIGYEYSTGTAALYDLNGRKLQSFTLDGNRTLPVDMTTYPTGIYIVEVQSNKEKHSIKIIKK